MSLVVTKKGGDMWNGNRGGVDGAGELTSVEVRLLAHTP